MSVSAPPPVRRRDQAGERTAMLICLVAGLVSLVAVLGIVLFTDDDADSNLGSPPGGPGGPADLGGTSQTGTPGQVAAGGGPGGQAGSAGPDLGSPASGLTPRSLLTNFPLPTGAYPSTLDIDRHRIPGERFFLVKAKLTSVKRFYDRRLPRMGVQWSNPQTSTDQIDNGPTRIVGWHGGLYVASPQINGFLSLDANYLDETPGQVRIDVRIDE